MKVLRWLSPYFCGAGTALGLVSLVVADNWLVLAIGLVGSTISFTTNVVLDQ